MYFKKNLRSSRQLQTSNTFVIEIKQTNKRPDSRLETRRNPLKFCITLVVMPFSNTNTSVSLQRAREGKVNELGHRIHDITGTYLLWLP